MTPERREPTISNITPDRDEIASHQQRTKVRPPPPPNHGGTPPPTRVQRSSLTPFALLLALTGLGLAGFVYWQTLGLQNRLAQADERIQSLEQRLELSDDESTESVTAIRAKLKWADSEIRKLWGVAHDRNRKAIADNKEQLAALDKSFKATAAETQKILASSSAQAASVAALESQTSARQAEVDRVAGDLVAQRQQLQSVVDQANRLDQQLGRLQTDIAGRVKTNEEAIEAIDAYRRNINRDLLRLQQQVQQGGRASTP
ncbi:hypothetical protein FKG94_11505 [Exilibacterium tricleocarpae]|uniref:Uncharacterized protein n=1 Tax=Exilibacterium tricleocarpae TaxID=2591008 RepID=A0A545TQI6_9GAMM|nr:hypothetical protein [Exilibacterium tricleocarpae]TQV79486.1 hypothetical protein FKG94_11505 [Exilibacterium tricleocarpae]